MVVGSFAFNGENARVFLQEKGTSGSVEISARVDQAAISGFQRNIEQSRTQGTMFKNYNGYNPANLEFAFVYDEESSVKPLINYVGSESLSSGVRAYTLNGPGDDREFKIKLCLEEYSDSFGDLTSADASKRFIFYNTSGLSWSSTVGVDEAVNGILNFFVLPFNSVGSSNYVELEKSSSQTVSQLESVESDFDNIMGY